MTNTTQENQPDAADLIEALFTHYQHGIEGFTELAERLAKQYSLESLEFNRLNEYNDQLEAENRIQAAEIAALQGKVATLEAEHERDMETINVAHDLARKAVAQKRQLELTQSNLAATQKELTALKGGDSPKKLREQIKRNKEKNAELTAKNERLQREAQQYRKQLKDIDAEMEGLKQEVYIASVKAANGSFTRLWSDGVQNIVLWPQVATTQNVETEETSKGRALLYIHQCGRAALMTFDQATNEARLSAAPKGGLRPTKAAEAFAQSWLYKVNAMQGGDVTASDLMATDL